MALKSPQIDGFPRGGSDVWDGLQAGAPLNRDWFSPNTGPALKQWDGAAWPQKPLKHWNGVLFDHYGKLKRWDGSAWQERPGIPTPPPPYVAPPAPPSLTAPLTGYTTGLWGAYSARRRMVPGYSGPLMQLTRVSGSTQANIGFYGDGVDTDALYAFLGPSGAGIVTTLYDQSGNGRNFVASTTSLRPALVSGAPGLEVMSFDGLTDGMTVSGFGGSFGSATFFLTGASLSTADQALFESSPNYNADSDTILIYYSATEGGMSVATHGVGGSYARSSYGDVRLSGIQAYRIDRAAAAFEDKTSLFVAGVKQTRTADADAGTIAGNFAANPLYFGSRAGASLFSRLNAYDLAIYSTALSDTDVAAISAQFDL